MSNEELIKTLPLGRLLSGSSPAGSQPFIPLLLQVVRPERFCLDEGFLVDEWYCLYDNYLELMSRVKGDISCHMVHKKHVPPYPEFKAWKKRKEEEEA